MGTGRPTIMLEYNNVKKDELKARSAIYTMGTVSDRGTVESEKY